MSVEISCYNFSSQLRKSFKLVFSVFPFLAHHDFSSHFISMEIKIKCQSYVKCCAKNKVPENLKEFGKKG